MLFTAPVFLFLFLPSALLCVGGTIKLSGKKSGMAALTLASVVFYGYWRLSQDGSWDDLILICISILSNFIIARLLSADGLKFKPTILAVGVTANLSILAYFKYAEFFLTNLGYGAISIGLLPLAISFYSFQQIAFIVDVYRSQDRRIPLLNYIATVLFFPHLIAGPLIHYQAIMRQFESRFSVSFLNIWCGLPIFAIGLVKKLAIADPISTIIDPLYTLAKTTPLEFFSAWTAALGYTAQLYFDFSGYSDMAIGLGMMFGIVLPVNFFSPYKATSIIEFWRRWHMTLSSFLRDYLYIPLGGKHLSRPRWYLNLMIVMLLGGLWHGAGWTFIFWGGLHGSYLVANHFWRNNVRLSEGVNAALRPLYAVLTFLSVVLAWIFFRSPNFTTAVNVIEGAMGLTYASLPGEVLIFLPNPNGYFLGIPCTGLGLTFASLVFSAAILVIAYFIIFFQRNAAQMFGLLSAEGTWDTAAVPTVGLICTRAIAIGAACWLAAFGVLGAQPSQFLYFQF